MNQSEWTLESIVASLGPADSPQPMMEEDHLPALEWAYREAASVLSFFNASDLKPVGEAPSEGDGAGALSALLVDCSLVQDENGHARWMLRNGVRKETLARLGDRAAMRGALDANATRPTDLLQKTLEEYINGRAAPLSEQNLEQLTHTVQVVGWLDGILDDLPDPDTLSHRIAWEELLQPFRYLVGDHFRGRKQELETLGRYVDAEIAQPPPRTRSGRLRGALLSGPYRSGRAQPLLIHGPGGMGKSTLVSKFILERVDVEPEARIPFAYINFDHPGMLPEEPITLLVEIVRQLGVQYEQAATACEDVRREWLERLVYTQEASGYVQTKGVTRSGSRRRGVASKNISSTRSRSAFLYDFRKIIDIIGMAEQPFLLVLDTFEEVQYLSQDFVAELWALFDDLQQIVPRLRPVLAGRGAVRRLATQELLLSNLDDEAARGFLAAHGIDDDKLAARLIEQVGGNPLSLRLAVEVIHQDADATGELKLKASNADSLLVAEELIQGQLYRRFLDHIHSQEIRGLAHPGLTLRIITPDLIREVLAVACGLDVPTQAEAQRLFDELAREVSLVTFDEDGALRHRPDVRRIMLDALRRDAPDKAVMIHKLAVEFYRQRSGIPARAEEIYHRLFSGSALARIDERWLEGVEPYLRPALDEIPPEKQPYLASRLGVTSDAFSWDETGLNDWEHHIETRVNDLMGLGRLDEALKLLMERTERTAGSPLYRLEAQIMERLERWPEARRIARDGIYSVRTTHTDGDFDAGMLLDLYLVAAHADEKLGHYGQAHDMLRAAAGLELDLSAGDIELLQLDIIMRQLRLHRIENNGGDNDFEELRNRARQKIDNTLHSGLRSQPQIVVNIIEEFGADDPALLGALMNLAAFTAYDDAQKEMLARALARWDSQLARETDERHPAASAAGLTIADEESAGEVWLECLRTLKPVEQQKLLRQLVDQFRPSERLVQTIAAIMRTQMTGAEAEHQLDNALTNSIQAALLSVFPERSQLSAMVRASLSENLETIAGSGIYVDTLHKLIAWADAQGRLQELVTAALATQPDSEELGAIVALLNPAPPDVSATLVTGGAMASATLSGDSGTLTDGISIGGDFSMGVPAMKGTVNRSDLPMEPPPGAIRGASVEAFVNPELVYNWSMRMREVARTICRIEVEERMGTGFLVGPNLIMTSRHLYGDANAVDPRKMRLRFDYLVAQNGYTDAHGTVYRVAKEWLIAEDEALNIALIRADAEPGLDLAPDTGERRGWLRFAPGYAPVTNEPAFVMHHRNGGFLVMEYLMIAFPPIESDTRIGFYNDSSIGAPGSGGAPCFDTRWEVIAIRESSGNLTDKRFDQNRRAIGAIRADKVLQLPEMHAALSDAQNLVN